jgi:hypothetical protein
MIGHTIFDGARHIHAFCFGKDPSLLIFVTESNLKQSRIANHSLKRSQYICLVFQCFIIVSEFKCQGLKNINQNLQRKNFHKDNDYNIYEGKKIWGQVKIIKAEDRFHDFPPLIAKFIYQF